MSRHCERSEAISKIRSKVRAAGSASPPRSHDVGCGRPATQTFSKEIAVYFASLEMTATEQASQGAGRRSAVADVV